MVGRTCSSPFWLVPGQPRAVLAGELLAVGIALLDAVGSARVLLIEILR
jgi:hypothetical protein